MFYAAYRDEYMRFPESFITVSLTWLWFMSVGRWTRSAGNLLRRLSAADQLSRTIGDGSVDHPRLRQSARSSHLRGIHSKNLLGDSFGVQRLSAAFLYPRLDTRVSDHIVFWPVVAILATDRPASHGQPPAENVARASAAATDGFLSVSDYSAKLHLIS